MSGVRTALFISLAANLLLAGVIGGAVLSSARHERAAAAQAVTRAPNLRAVMEAVPAERRQQIRAKVIAAWREGRPARLEARAARAEVYKLAGDDAYDAAAVKAAFARVRAADAKIAEHLQGTIADALTELMPEERRAVLQRMAQRRGAMGARRALMAPEDPPPSEAAQP
jgi:uncharacterized membrane protein